LRFIERDAIIRSKVEIARLNQNSIGLMRKVRIHNAAARMRDRAARENLSRSTGYYSICVLKKQTLVFDYLEPKVSRAALISPIGMRIGRSTPTFR